METVKDLSSILECLLFTAGRPLTAKDFAKVLEMEETEIKKSLDEMVEQRKGFGIVLLNSGDEYQLATSSKYSTEVKNFLNAELREKLTDATVEVLAIIAYRQPISKAEIEAIRGVNSQYSLRNLLMRGLIEKIQNPSDARSFLYQTTTEFLMHMGIKSAKDLPEFEKLVSQIKLPQTAALDNQAKDTAQQAEPEAAPPEAAPQETPQAEAAAEEQKKEENETEQDPKDEVDEDDDDDGEDDK
jgi:segregation and condensation protein B